VDSYPRLLLSLETLRRKSCLAGLRLNPSMRRGIRSPHFGVLTGRSEGGQPKTGG
jgi:hypothetical protein